MSTPDTGPTSFGPWRSNRTAAIGLVVLLVPLLVYLLNDPDTFRKLRDGFYLGIIPLLTVAGMLVCAVSMMFDGKRTEPFHKPNFEDRPTWRRMALAVASLLAMYGYYRLMLMIGFPAATLLFIAGLMRVLGVHNLTVLALTALVVTGFVLLVFTLLGFSLPLGPGALN